jgi:hypothetical protein
MLTSDFLKDIHYSIWGVEKALYYEMGWGVGGIRSAK